MTAGAPDRFDAPAAHGGSFLAAYGRLVRFSHTVFAMPFALMAMFLAAAGWPGWPKAALVVACMVTARSAAMTFNRIVDVRIDATNPRTAGRPLQTGRIALSVAWAMYAACCAAFVACCGGFYLAFGNPWPLAGAVPVLAFISGYSYTKRFTWLCHLVLGAALGLSPIAAWVAVRPETAGAAAAVLGGAVLCWVGGFDIIYALQDLAIDRQTGIHSLPARFGPGGALWISRSLHAAAVAMLVGLWRLTPLGGIYLVGVAAAAAVLVVEQSLLSAREHQRAGPVFFYANAVVSLVLAAAAIADVLLAAG